MATVTMPTLARVGPIASIWERLPVMPCWKITTGQPAAGLVIAGLLGTVISTGRVSVEVATGFGKQIVVLALGIAVWPSGSVAPTANAPQGTLPRKLALTSGVAGLAFQNAL